MVGNYFLGENPVKTLNKAIDGAMQRLGRSYQSSASMAELRRHVRNYLVRNGIVYTGQFVPARSLQLWWQIINAVISHYLKGGNRHIDAALEFAIKQAGVTIPCQEKTRIKALLLHVLRKRGIDWEVACGLKEDFLKKPLGRTIKEIKSLRKSNTEICAKRTKSYPKQSKKIWKLVFAMLKGRKPWYPFGQKTSKNDEGWNMLPDCHWDNCKTQYRPKLLAKPIYELLAMGARKEDIICQYGILVRKYHVLAVDLELSSYEPTKLVRELKENVTRKFLNQKPITN